MSFLAIVSVDSQRRIYIPKEVPFEAERAVIMQQGSSYLLIPIPKEVIEVDVPLSTKELKRLAEKKAKEDALARARRRKQM